LNFQGISFYQDTEQFQFPYFLVYQKIADAERRIGDKTKPPFVIYSAALNKTCSLRALPVPAARIWMDVFGVEGWRRDAQENKPWEGIVRLGCVERPRRNNHSGSGIKLKDFVAKQNFAPS